MLVIVTVYNLCLVSRNIVGQRFKTFAGRGSETGRGTTDVRKY